MKIDLAVVDPENNSHISIFEGGSAKDSIYVHYDAINPLPIWNYIENDNGLKHLSAAYKKAYSHREMEEMVQLILAGEFEGKHLDLHTNCIEFLSSRYTENFNVYFINLFGAYVCINDLILGTDKRFKRKFYYANNFPKLALNGELDTYPWDVFIPNYHKMLEDEQIIAKETFDIDKWRAEQAEFYKKVSDLLPVDWMDDK